MRFALLGDHPDGLAMAAALVAAGRHEVSTYGAADDVEEVLADPAVEAVIVAGRPDARPAQLRRALQSERHVLCVYPPDPTPELAYEADMLRQDSGRVLLPLLPGASHPAIRRLADFVRVGGKGTDPAAPVGALRLLEMVQIADAPVEGKPTFPGWELFGAWAASSSRCRRSRPANTPPPASRCWSRAGSSAADCSRPCFCRPARKWRNG